MVDLRRKDLKMLYRQKPLFKFFRAFYLSRQEDSFRKMGDELPKNIGIQLNQ